MKQTDFSDTTKAVITFISGLAVGYILYLIKDIRDTRKEAAKEKRVAVSEKIKELEKVYLDLMSHTRQLHYSMLRLFKTKMQLQFRERRINELKEILKTKDPANIHLVEMQGYFSHVEEQYEMNVNEKAKLKERGSRIVLENRNTGGEILTCFNRISLIVGHNEEVFDEVKYSKTQMPDLNVSKFVREDLLTGIQIDKIIENELNPVREQFEKNEEVYQEKILQLIKEYKEKMNQ